MSVSRQTQQRASEAFAACSNIATAAEQLANIANGDPVFESLAMELANTAVVVEIVAHALQDEENGGYPQKA